MAEWQPIETAPRDGTLIDLWVGGERLPDCFWWGAEWADPDEHCWHQKYAETSQDCSFKIDAEPSHWMTRPGAPDGAKVRDEARPDILERLSYHQLERDDLTLDECLSFLAKGWKTVHGRTERQMVMQILELLASAPAGVKACRKCGGAMKPGKAVAEAFLAGDEGTISPAAHTGPAPLVDCMKCSACGWSVTAGVTAVHQQVKPPSHPDGSTEQAPQAQDPPPA